MQTRLISYVSCLSALWLSWSASISCGAPGDVDPLFNPVINEGVSQSSFLVNVLVVAPAEDDKVFIGGNFKSAGSPPVPGTVGIAKLNRDGSVDTGFAATVALNFGPLGSNLAGVHTIAVQPDGKIVIGGVFTKVNQITRNGIARLNPDGTVDTSFDPGKGVTGTAPLALYGINRLRLEPDGKILIGAVPATDIYRPGISVYTDSYDGTPVKGGIARLNTNGRLDTTFDPKVEPEPFALRQSDGRRLILHEEATSVEFVRLNPDNTIDSSFHIPRVDHPPFSVIGRLVTAASVQADDKILAGMTESAPLIQWRALRRLNPNGSFDSTFPAIEDLDGMISDADFGLPAGIFPLPGGDFIIAGAFHHLKGIARDGLARIVGEPATSPIKIVSQPQEQKALFGGSASFSVTVSSTAPVTYQWQHRGVDLPGRTDRTLQLDAVRLEDAGDYRVIVSNSNSSSASESAWLTVLAGPTGRVDATFNGGSGADSSIFVLVRQPDAKLLIAGSFATFDGTPRGGIARLNADGTLDLSFNPGSGMPVASNVFATALLIQPDRKIVVGGRFKTFNGTAANGLVRLHSDGSLDSEFKPDPRGDVEIRALALQSDGKLLVGGRFSYRAKPSVESAGLVRLHPDGAFDDTFNKDIFRQVCNFTATCTPWPEINVLSVGADSRIIAGGFFLTEWDSSRLSLARFNADGTVDASFGPQLSLWVGNLGGFGIPTVDTYDLQADGSIVLGGYFESRTATSPQNSRLARFDAQQHSLPQFETHWALSRVFDLGGVAIRAVTTQASGEVVVAGLFASTPDVPRNNLARFQSDGALDSTFDPGTGPDGEVRALLIEPDGNILIAGAFTHVNGIPRKRLARLIGTPMDALEIQNAVPKRPGLELSMATLTNYTYTLEYKDTFGPNQAESWKPVSAAPGDGTVKTFSDATGGTAQRFYRVRIE